jgi:S1-C subfamily serine protease
MVFFYYLSNNILQKTKMKHLKSVILVLLITFSMPFTILHTSNCFGSKPSSGLVDNVYSSVVLISRTKLKTSVWEALSFAAFVAGTVTGTGSYGMGSYIPGHTEKNIGTGFQTEWGIVTNSHVMNIMPTAVLTSFHGSNYRIKKINRIKFNDKDNLTSIHNPKIMNAMSKETNVYDWGDIGIDLALIHVQVPGAYPLPLATDVIIGEEVFTLSHPNAKQFTPAIGKINRVIYLGGTKYLELFIESAPGASGSPILNMKGEVVGIMKGRFKEFGSGVAVHVDELRKIIGLPPNNIPEKEYTIIKEPWNGSVYSTEYSRLFHRPDCKDLSSNTDGLIIFSSKENSMRDGGTSCPKCDP